MVKQNQASCPGVRTVRSSIYTTHVYCWLSAVRKWKKKSTLGKEGSWHYEIGEDLRPINLDLENISESRGNVS